MIRWKIFALASCLGLATFVATQTAQADSWNKKTIITVNEPIQVPGKVLQPGKYVIKLMDSPSNRHIVQIFNEREDQLITTILAIPNYRLQPTGKTEFQWWETPAGQPKALRAWFYPGDNFGQEFAYPKREAVQIARQTHQPVPVTYAQTEKELATAPVKAVDETGAEREVEQVTAAAAAASQPASTPARTEVAQAQQPAASTPASTSPAMTQTSSSQTTQQASASTSTSASSASKSRTLPSTASGFPLIGLAGLLALGASLGFRSLSR